MLYPHLSFSHPRYEAIVAELPTVSYWDDIFLSSYCGASFLRPSNVSGPPGTEKHHQPTSDAPARANLGILEGANLTRRSDKRADKQRSNAHEGQTRGLINRGPTRTKIGAIKTIRTNARRSASRAPRSAFPSIRAMLPAPRPIDTAAGTGRGRARKIGRANTRTWLHKLAPKWLSH